MTMEGMVLEITYSMEKNFLSEGEQFTEFTGQFYILYGFKTFEANLNWFSKN